MKPPSTGISPASMTGKTSARVARVVSFMSGSAWPNSPSAMMQLRASTYRAARRPGARKTPASSLAESRSPYETTSSCNIG